MKAHLLVSIVGLGASQGSCAVTPTEPDELCRQIAQFANDSPTSTPRTVRLTTDWGGVFSRSDVIAEKACLHDTDKPGKALCAYLLENTSTEFATVNYRRALACIGKASPGLSPTDDELLPPSASSSVVDGRPVRSSVTVRFTPGTQSTPPALSISTGKVPTT
jgi:hypothetical protein